MPLARVAGLVLPVFNFDLSAEYWPGLTALVRGLHGEAEIKEDAAVQAVLKACFARLGEELLALIRAETHASFYLAVHEYHENSVALWQLQSGGQQLNIPHRT